MWSAFWAELYAFLGKNALKGCLGVLAAILVAIPAYIYFSVRIENPVEITYIEDIVDNASEETDDMLFLNEDNWNDTFDIRGPYSYYNLLSDEEQTEVVARAYATDAYYLGIIAQVEDLLDDYEKELKRPEKIYGKDKYAVAMQSLLDALPALPHYGADVPVYSDSSRIDRGVYEDNICTGYYLATYRRNVWYPGASTSVFDERNYEMKTYDYGDKMSAYLSTVQKMLTDMKDEATDRSIYQKEEAATKVRLDYRDYVEALEAICEARALMYKQLAIDPLNVTPQHLAELGYPVAA